jgi:hypothetical protein
VGALGAAEEGLDLASERRVVDFHLDAADDAEICGHLLAADDFDDVTADELLSGDLGYFSVSEHFAVGGEHVLETLHEGLGFGTLGEGDGPRE